MTSSVIHGLALDIHGPEAAPALMLLHPIATSARIWGPQLLVWARQRRVICIDLPGHGRNPAPSLEEATDSLADHGDRIVRVLDALGLASVSLLGLSWGGMIAQSLAIHHPQRLDALVLAHTSARTPEPVQALWAQRMEQAQTQGMAAQTDATLARWFTRNFLEHSPLTTQWVAEQIQGTPVDGYVAAAQSIRGLDHLDALAEVHTPTLVLAGEHDTAAPPAVASAIADQMPRARLQILNGAAHLGNVEQPIAFTELVGAFLDEVVTP